jgi:transcription elongation factor Elf1
MGASGQTHICPHCNKPFSADLLGPHTARAGYKCPHCGLFVPLDRTEETEPADAAA